MTRSVPSIAALVLSGLSLAACGQNAADDRSQTETAAPAQPTPEQFLGVWGADCAQPFVRFEERQVHIYPDGLTYPLVTSVYDGHNLNVTYEAGNGVYEETYVADGEMLRHDSGVYDGERIAFDKAPMRRCD